MTVNELIDRLKEYNPYAQVVISTIEGNRQEAFEPIIVAEGFVAMDGVEDPDVVISMFEVPFYSTMSGPHPTIVVKRTDVCKRDIGTIG